MDNLLLTCVAIALLYYFLVSKKKTSPSSQLTYKHQATQTEPLEPSQVEFPSAQTYEYEPGPQILNCPGPLTEPQATPQIKQLEKDLTAKQRTIENLNKSYTRLENKRKAEQETSNQQINSLQQQLNTLKTQLNSLTSEHKKDNTELEKTLETLIKAVNEINLELD